MEQGIPIKGYLESFGPHYIQRFDQKINFC